MIKSKNEGDNFFEVWGSGKPRREFLWSEDMADACVFLLENRDFRDIFSNNSLTRDTFRHL